MIRKMVICALLALPPSEAVFADNARQAIHTSAQDAQPLMPGMMAPEFEVMDLRGEAFSFDPASMQKPLVLSFYRGGWCPFCNLHLSEMRHAEKDLLEMGFNVWFISIDRPELLAGSLTIGEVSYTLLSDSKLHATRAFGIAFRITDELHERYLTRNNIDVEAASGETHHVLPVPSTFIIGEDGKIVFGYSNPDYAVRLHPDVLLAAARAYTEDADERLRSRRKAQRAAEE